MDKQQFDHIENRIRQSAEGISVPNSEEAWNKMEVLLDKEFKKVRRKGGAWWWLFLLIGLIAGSGIYLYQIYMPMPAKKISNNPVPTVPVLSPKNKPNIDEFGSKATTEQNTLASQKVNKKIYQPMIGDDVVNKQSDKLLHSPVYKDKMKDEISGKENRIRNSISTTNSVKNSAKPDFQKPFFKRKLANKKSAHKTGSGLIKKPGIYLNSSKEDISKDQVGIKSLNAMSKLDSGIISVFNSFNNPVSTVINPPPAIVQDSSVNTDLAKKTGIKLNSGIPVKGLYFLVSLSGDASDVRKFSTNKINPVYGIGIGYRFNKRLSVQTGIYTGKKIYTAGPQDYKVNPGSYVAKIISADAVCSIYDIPLAIKYDIISRNKHDVYFVAGLSSYILQREIYDMHFYNPMGSYRHMSYTYKDNKNFFSLLNLSMGFEHKLSDAFYIQVEPYIKLPLAGVGEGDVKLYSAGLQLGIKYQPVKKIRRR